MYGMPAASRAARRASVARSHSSGLADELLGPGGQFGFELGESERPQDPQHERQQAGQLGASCSRRAEDVGVVLGDAADPQQAR